jgi:hypothetical protein
MAIDFRPNLPSVHPCQRAAINEVWKDGLERYFLPAGLPAGLLPADFGFAVCRCFEDSLFFAASAPLAPALLDFVGMLEDSSRPPARCYQSWCAKLVPIMA